MTDCPPKACWTCGFWLGSAPEPVALCHGDGENHEGEDFCDWWQPRP